MVYKPNPEEMKTRSAEIIKARKWGVKIIMSVFVVGTVVSVIQKVFLENPDVLNYMYLALYLSVLLLIFFWLWATEKELEMLFTWLDPERYRPPDTVLETVLILFFAVVLVVMLVSSQHILIFALVFTLYSFVGVPTGFYLEKQLRRAIEKSNAKINKEIEKGSKEAALQHYKKAVLILDEYFIKRPMKTRGVIIFASSLLGLWYAIRWAIHGHKVDAMYSYGIFIAIILLSEFIINYWRFVRDNKMRAVLEEIDELNTAQPNQ